MPDESDAGVNLQCLRNSDYALSGIGALEICIHPAESIVVEAAIHKHNQCQRLSTGADSVGMKGFYLSDVIVEFILRAASKAAGPSGVDTNLVCTSPYLSKPSFSVWPPMLLMSKL